MYSFPQGVCWTPWKGTKQTRHRNAANTFNCSGVMPFHCVIISRSIKQPKSKYLKMFGQKVNFSWTSDFRVIQAFRSSFRCSLHLAKNTVNYIKIYHEPVHNFHLCQASLRNWTVQMSPTAAQSWGGYQNMGIFLQSIILGCNTETMNVSSGNSYREGIISLKSSPGGQSLSFNTIGSPSSVLRRPNLKY